MQHGDVRCIVANILIFRGRDVTKTSLFFSFETFGKYDIPSEIQEHINSKQDIDIDICISHQQDIGCSINDGYEEYDSTRRVLRVVHCTEFMMKVVLVGMKW